MCEGDGVAELVERQTQDSMTPVTRLQTLSQAQEQIVSFSESKCCADWLPVCPTPVCLHTRKTDHVRTL